MIDPTAHQPEPVVDADRQPEPVVDAGRPPEPAVDPLAALAGHIPDPELRALALAHRSYVAEADAATSNERLELLGDSVLSLVVTEHLYCTRPALSEGDLTRIRAAVVSTAALAPVASELGIGAAVLLGRGEATSGGRAKPSILADTFEAVIGATYLCGGLDAARELVLGALGPRIESEASRPELGDAKNRLQELAARLGMAAPRYRSSYSGPEHARWWCAESLLGGEVLGSGEGASRKQAERVAAAEACEALAARRSVGHGGHGDGGTLSAP